MSTWCRPRVSPAYPLPIHPNPMSIYRQFYAKQPSPILCQFGANLLIQIQSLPIDFEPYEQICDTQLAQYITSSSIQANLPILDKFSVSILLYLTNSSDHWPHRKYNANPMSNQRKSYANLNIDQSTVDDVLITLWTIPCRSSIFNTALIHHIHLSITYLDRQWIDIFPFCIDWPCIGRGHPNRWSIGGLVLYGEPTEVSRRRTISQKKSRHSNANLMSRWYKSENSAGTLQIQQSPDLCHYKCTPKI